MTSRSRSRLDLWKIVHSFRNEFFTCLFKIQNVQVIQKWCHQMLQNDVIKCCKMMSPHSNEPATWRNCVSRRHFYVIQRRDELSPQTCICPKYVRKFVCISKCVVVTHFGNKQISPKTNRSINNKCIRRPCHPDSHNFLRTSQALTSVEWYTVVFPQRAWTSTMLF